MSEQPEYIYYPDIDELSGWNKVALEEAAEVFDRQRIPLNENERQKRQGPYPYCGANGIVDYIDDYIFDGEYVLLAEDGGYWKSFDKSAYIMKGRFWVNNHAHILRAINGVCTNEYLMFALNYMNIAAYISGTTRGKLTQGVMRKIPIMLPPYEEQLLIGNILNTHVSSIEATEKVISATKELKKSLMQYLFTYGHVPIDQADQVPLKETEIGMIPEHWEVIQLSDVIVKTAQADPSKKPVKSIKYVDVSCISSDQLTIKGYNTFLGADAPSRARKIIKKGDVIFATIRPYLRRIAMVTDSLDDELCSTAFCVLRNDGNRAINQYIFYSVSRDQFIKNVSELQKGSSYPAVTDKDVKRQTIPLPTIEEQKIIAEILYAIDEKLIVEESARNTLEELFKSMLQHLLTGKLRVKDLELPKGVGVV